LNATFGGTYVSLITVHYHFYGSDPQLNNRLESIMTTQAQLAAQLTALAEQATKAKNEVLAKFDELQVAITNAGNVTPEVETALAALATAVQATDDLVPDAPTA